MISINKLPRERFLLPLLSSSFFLSFPSLLFRMREYGEEGRGRGGGGTRRVNGRGEFARTIYHPEGELSLSHPPP